ncbi:MAG: hypothetical protein ACXVKH_06000 [Candidatus Angelobacter sp.]
MAAEISKLLLWESLAAKAFVVNANTNVANMILENNEDFITAPYVLSRSSAGTGLGRPFFLSDELFNSSLMTYNSSLWVKKQARACVPISGDCSRLGPPKPWARTIPEPRKPTAAFNSCRTQSSLLAKTMPINQKFQPIWICMAF